MGVPVTGYDDFERKLENLAHRRSLMVFLLYDSRPTQQVVAEFTKMQGEWIDEIAHHMGTYFFFPLQRVGEKFDNPSARVCRLFNLELRNLPGVLLFAPPGTLKRSTPKKAIFLPIRTELFADYDRIERFFLDLASIVEEFVDQAEQGAIDMDALGHKIRTLRRREGERSVISFLRRGAGVIFLDVPRQLLTEAAQAFGTALGQRVTGG